MADKPFGFRLQIAYDHTTNFFPVAHPILAMNSAGDGFTRVPPFAYDVLAGLVKVDHAGDPTQGRPDCHSAGQPTPSVGIGCYAFKGFNFYLNSSYNAYPEIHHEVGGTNYLMFVVSKMF